MPKFGVCLWHFESLAIVMTMPEASVDEDARSVFPHDEVGMSGKPTMKEAVSESLSEEEFPHN